MIWFVRAIHRNANIFSLFGGELAQFNTNLFQVQAGHFFRQGVWAGGKRPLRTYSSINRSASVWLVKELLITKLGWLLHNPGLPNVLGEHINCISGWEGVFIHLGFDVQFFNIFGPCRVHSPEFRCQKWPILHTMLWSFIWRICSK